MTTELITASDIQQQAAPSALADLRARAMQVPVETMLQGLAEYAEKRNAFRAWLLSQMTEGVHYGTPPGCAGSGATEIQYKKRPSLYKAGAEFVADILGLRAEFKPLMLTEQTINQPSANICVECKLYSRANGEIVGQGIGGRTVGEKKMGFNASLKMAEKSALVMAVLSTYGLSDLFTQDIEDYQPDANPHPERNASAPTATPRTERGEMTENQVRMADLFTRMQKVRGAGYSKKLFLAYCQDAIPGGDKRPLETWDASDFQLISQKIATEEF